LNSKNRAFALIKKLRLGKNLFLCKKKKKVIFFFGSLFSFFCRDLFLLLAFFLKKQSFGLFSVAGLFCF